MISGSIVFFFSYSFSFFFDLEFALCTRRYKYAHVYIYIDVRIYTFERFNSFFVSSAFLSFLFCSILFESFFVLSIPSFLFLSVSLLLCARVRDWLSVASSDEPEVRSASVNQLELGN